MTGINDLCQDGPPCMQNGIHINDLAKNSRCEESILEKCMCVKLLSSAFSGLSHNSVMTAHAIWAIDVPARAPLLENLTKWHEPAAENVGNRKAKDPAQRSMECTSFDDLPCPCAQRPESRNA